MNAQPSPVISSRLCACNCGERFTPPASRPGQMYIFGHKPLELREKVYPRRAVTGQAPPQTSKERKSLDYRLALGTAERELKDLGDRIEAVDNQLIPIYIAKRELEERKDTLHAMHITVAGAIEFLKALAAGEPVQIPEGNA